MDAGDVDGADESHGRDVGIQERRADDAGDQVVTAVAGDGRGVAIGDTESGDALARGALGTFDGDAQTLAEADGDEHVLAREQLDFVLEISFAGDRRFGIEAEAHQSVGEVVGERRCEVAADDQNAAGAMDELGDFDDGVAIEAGAEQVEIIVRFVQAAIDMIGDAAFFARSGFERGVRGHARHQVLAEVAGEIGESFVAEGLDGAHDGGSVDAVALGDFARGEEAGFLAVIDDGADQLLAMRTEARMRCSEALFHGRG